MSTADGGVTKSEGFTKDVEDRTASLSEKIPPARPGTRTIRAACSSMCKSGVGSIFSTRSLDGLKPRGGSFDQNQHTNVSKPRRVLCYPRVSSHDMRRPEDQDCFVVPDERKSYLDTRINVYPRCWAKWDTGIDPRIASWEDYRRRTD